MSKNIHKIGYVLSQYVSKNIHKIGCEKNQGEFANKTVILKHLYKQLKYQTFC